MDTLTTNNDSRSGRMRHSVQWALRFPALSAERSGKTGRGAFVLMLSLLQLPGCGECGFSGDYREAEIEGEDEDGCEFDHAGDGQGAPGK